MNLEQKKYIIQYSNTIIIAKKKNIKYKIINFLTLDKNIQNKIITSMIKSSKFGGIYDDTIMPKNSFIININDEQKRKLYINTFFKENDKIEYEEKNIEFKENNILIKGPISEIYKLKSQESLTNKYELSDNNKFYKTISTPLHLVKIDKQLFKILQTSGLFRKNKNNIEINTDYGGKHLVNINDYIMIEGTSFYRIKNIAFKKTYNKI
jgi:hypothetical protein